MKTSGETLEQNFYGNLHLLIQTALAWVVAQFDELRVLVGKELEAVSYNDLAAREGMSYTAAGVADVGKTRIAP